GTRWAAGTATRSAPSTSRARLSAPTAATTPPAWRTPPSTTPGASPCCGSCPRPPCPSCGRRPCPPAPPPTSPLWSSSIRLKHSFPLGDPQRASPFLSRFFHTDRGYRYLFPLVLGGKPCYNTGTGTPYGCAGRAARRRRATGGLLWCA